MKRRPGSPSSFLLALLITPPWRSLEAPCVMLLDSLFPQLSVSRQLIFTVLNAKYVHPRPALLTDPFYKCNVITNVKNSCREITTTYLSAGHIESEAAGWKSGRLHCSLPRSYKSSSRSRLCWLRNNIYFPSAALRGNIPLYKQARAEKLAKVYINPRTLSCFGQSFTSLVQFPCSMTERVQNF